MNVLIVEGQQEAHLFPDCYSLQGIPDSDVENADFCNVHRAICSRCWDRAPTEQPPDEIQ